MANSRQILLSKFRDNTSGNINASDLRIFVNAMYDEMLLLEAVLDRADIYDTDKVSTINQVSLIKTSLDNLTDFFNSDVYKKDETYTKSEVQQILDLDYYKKNETYSKAQIDALIAAL